MRQLVLSIIAMSLTLAAPHSEARSRQIHIVTTGDVHGSYFDEPYVGTRKKTSLMSVKWYVDSLRNAVGRDNVLLIDVGDCLQGDNAAYYFNYVASGGAHIFPRLASSMGYDVCVLGNHDIETGHATYDKVAKEMSFYGIPYLAGNAITPSGESYFPEYAVIEKDGVKVLVLGYDNANIAAWLSQELWSGMSFRSLVPFVQQRVDELNSTVKPDITVLAIHSGTGDGDGSQLENQGLDIFNTIRGVDVMVCGHDHRPLALSREGCCLLDGGARAGMVGHAVVELNDGAHSCGKSVLLSETVRLDKSKVDEAMKLEFRTEYDAVKSFTLRKVGAIAMPLRTRDAYSGMCDYLNLIHTVQLSVPEAQISFAAPLTYDGTVREGTVIFNDMFTIYPYENQLFVVRLKGSEIVSAMEYSYDSWIRPSADHVLRISKVPDPRTGAENWSFDRRPYNFDSAAGLIYSVDVSCPVGRRVIVKSLADGSEFDPDAMYNVAMTSYRANGGGDIITKGVGLDSRELEERIVARYPEIRELIYRYIMDCGTINSELVGNRSLIGEWHFEPRSSVDPVIKADMELLFGAGNSRK